jgi:glycyl-tRNA synthetase (class II)
MKDFAKEVLAAWDKELKKAVKSFNEDDIEKLTEKYVYDKYGFENLSPEAWGNEGMHAFIIGEKLKNPSTGKDADWTEVRQFNLMLNTHL